MPAAPDFTRFPNSVLNAALGTEALTHLLDLSSKVRGSFVHDPWEQVKGWGAPKNRGRKTGGS